MQIDVLSQNTLKLTLSRLDMFDLDIKYESLSGKNPDTKRLLSHVLRTVRLDKSAGVDFSGERLFVEAFPRPDGGCMLYISCLEEASHSSANSSSHTSSQATERKAVRLAAKAVPASSAVPKVPAGYVKSVKGDSKREKLLCRFDSVKELEGACKSLSWQLAQERISSASSLYSNGAEYRMLFCSANKKLISAIVSEYGEILSGEYEFSFTHEHYNLIAAENAVEKMNGIL